MAMQCAGFAIEPDEQVANSLAGVFTGFSPVVFGFWLVGRSLEMDGEVDIEIFAVEPELLFDHAPSHEQALIFPQFTLAGLPSPPKRAGRPFTYASCAAMYVLAFYEEKRAGLES